MSVSVWKTKDVRDKTPWRVVIKSGGMVSVYRYRDERDARDHAALAIEHENDPKNEAGRA